MMNEEFPSCRQLVNTIRPILLGIPFEDAIGALGGLILEYCACYSVNPEAF